MNATPTQSVSDPAHRGRYLDVGQVDSRQCASNCCIVSRCGAKFVFQDRDHRSQEKVKSRVDLTSEAHPSGHCNRVIRGIYPPFETAHPELPIQSNFHPLHVPSMSLRATSRDIYVFRHIITSQTILSTTPAAVSNDAIKQLPHGRRTRPVSLRKDHWEPLLRARFESTEEMRKVLARMHDYRRWRQASPTSPSSTSSDESGGAGGVLASLPRKVVQRRQAASDMTASSVADLSDAIARNLSTGVQVDWLDLERRQHASSWPENVRHAQGIQLAKTYRFGVLDADEAAVQVADVQEVVEPARVQESTV